MPPLKGIRDRRVFPNILDKTGFNRFLGILFV